MWKSILALTLAFTGSVVAETNVLAFAGSTRKDSANKKLINEAAAIARKMGANVTVIDLKDYPMPFYDGDLEKEGMPANAKRLRELMKNNQVIIIASPEYNGSLSGILKNAIDWTTRSEEGAPSRDAFKDKKFIIMSASPGPSGGSRGLDHLRTIIGNVGGIVLPQQVTIGNAFEAFNEQGKLKDSKYTNELEQTLSQALKQPSPALAN